ncbi:MAG TPA: hypothetical protein VGF16_16800 [Bryobacteraceae bacterium]|jgi:hypothetical protein
MALTYDDSAQLMNDAQFRGRVKVAALTYAQYIALQPATSGARIRWAQQVMQQPDAMATVLTPPTVMNPNVQAAGAAITDPDLQSAVQAVADVMM